MNHSDEEVPLFDSIEDESLFAQAVLGERTRAFLTTDVGKFLIGCAKQEIEQCGLKLIKTPSWRKNRINQLQMKAKAAENFLIWINDAIAIADHAAHELRVRDGQYDEE